VRVAFDVTLWRCLALRIGTRLITQTEAMTGPAGEGNMHWVQIEDGRQVRSGSRRQEIDTRVESHVTVEGVIGRRQLKAFLGFLGMRMLHASRWPSSPPLTPFLGDGRTNGAGGR